MENSVHDDLGRADLVEDRVRKSPKEGTPHRGIDKRVGLGLALDRRDTGIDGGKEIGGVTVQAPTQYVGGFSR